MVYRLLHLTTVAATGYGTAGFVAVAVTAGVAFAAESLAGAFGAKTILTAIAWYGCLCGGVQ